MNIELHVFGYVKMLCQGPLKKLLDETSPVADILRETLPAVLERVRAEAYAEAERRITGQIKAALDKLEGK